MDVHSKKVFVVGDTGCGKTSIIKTFCNEEAPMDTLPTTLDKHVTDVEVNGIKFELEIWETLCKHHYRVSAVNIRRSIYKKADIIIIVYDISRRQTLDSVTKKWIQEVNLFCRKNTPVILVGNKKDCRNDGRLYLEKLVEYPEGLGVAEEISAATFMESSAMTRQGIRDIFVNAVKVLQPNSSCQIL